MHTLIKFFLILLLASPSFAQEKESKIEGLLCCAKCSQKKSNTCQIVLEYWVQKGGTKRAIVYYLDDEGTEEEYFKKLHNSKSTHRRAPAPILLATVTGKVTNKDGRLYIKPSKVTWLGQE